MVGLATMLVVFGAVPAVLVGFVGWPVPHAWRASTIVSWHGLLDGLALVAWFAWAACCAPVATKVIGRVRHREIANGPGASWADRLAARIAIGILVLAPLSGLATSAGAATPPVVAAAAVAAPSAGSSVAVPTIPASSAVAATTLPTQYTVQEGDDLWSIADTLYGDGGDWEILAKANLGRTMDDGTQFTDPSLIMAGWVLVVPPLPSEPGLAVASLRPSTTASTPAPASAPATPIGRPAVRNPDRTSNAVGRPGRNHQIPASSPRTPAQGHHSALPELAALGLGAIVAAALARRARRTRLARSLERHEGESVDRQSDLAEETASLLMPFDGIPALDWLERANRHLGLVLEQTEEVTPGIICLRMGPVGVTALLDRPVDWAPPGWRPRGAGQWLLPAPLDATLGRRELEQTPPLIRALVPIGENAEGSWFACLEPGSCLPVVGAGAEDTLAAMESALESWSWSAELLVTRSSAAVDEALLGSTRRQAGAGGDRPAIVFLGDPDDLRPSVGRACITITTQPRRASRLLVAVDGGFASLHPFGITVRPNRLDPDRRRAVCEVVEAVLEPDDFGEEPVPRHPDGLCLVTSQPALPLVPPAQRAVRRVVVTPPTETAAPETVATGTATIEVRLLTGEPRLDGLAGALPPKRARRATELVAYLALHQPEPVTSDRLRTRVLGSPDADAAAKTLFNTVGAARRAMGNDAEGHPHLPPATKAGHYRLGPHVTTDVDRALDLLDRAEECEDPEQVMAYLRAALELVESEPLARVYSGYSWWRAEGHERRIAGCLVDAACRLARLAAPAGHGSLARWAIDQARLVEPYSEALARAAMEAAAEAGDIDGLRREWLDCKRRVDELDPGSVPSESTEQLYEELRRSLPVETAVSRNAR